MKRYRLAQSRALLYASQIDLTDFESLLSLGQDSQRALVSICRPHACSSKAKGCH